MNHKIRPHLFDTYNVTAFLSYQEFLLQMKVALNLQFYHLFFSQISLKMLSSVMVYLSIQLSSASVCCRQHTEAGTSSAACNLSQITFASASLSPTLSVSLSLKFAFLK